ncbi:glycosyl transferase, group 2 family protein [Leptotrichia trevisanii]|uniref:Glycosyl transferase, group 2 family protein n=1 Tax=Leptotrichia trevisanii TaxID=109328 RepID=A0A510KMM2_9FUSO|nr:prepilin-type N-terminal cleavage/methylation domain-containing protein [Leptotrichia trevisanii]BBM52958.1 glycosyl transferase, group 2 family protein [Leptotrichia trevisanii]
MRRNRGETLIESLISMFFVTVIIVPVANLFLQTFKTDIKVDNLNEKNVNIENIAEILKAKKYNEIVNFIGKYEISKIEDFYNRFAVEKKYQVLKNLEQKRDKKGKFQEDKINVEIKRTDGYFMNEFGQKEYIFEINIDKIKDYYFPNIDESS